MQRCAVALALLPLAGLLLAGEPAELSHVIALEKTIQRVSAKAEPAIACILVSRSDLYRKLARSTPTETPGQLGGFDASILSALDRDEQARLRRLLNLADPGHVPEAFGSGVVLDEKGLVLTNYHVVLDATKVFLRLPGGKAGYADIHAADPRSDLAVLRLSKAAGPLPTVPLTREPSFDRGQFVIALANPYAAGFRDGQPSVSWGLISNVRRRAPGIYQEDEGSRRPLHALGTLLQTDVRLNLGCSGGALLNLRGELIGLTTALAAIQGTDNPGGFALPLDATYRRIIEVLLRGEEVEYGFLGVSFVPTRTGTSAVVVDTVIPGSPADRDAKLRKHDIILAINGTPVKTTDDVFLTLGTQLAGAKVALDVRRQGRPHQTHAVLSKFHVPGKKIASSLGDRPYVRGLRVDHASLLVQAPHSLSRVPPGVLIADVQPKSAAAEAQLRPGEIITHVNQQQVLTPSAFYRTVAALNGPLEMTLYPGSPSEPAIKVTVR